MQSLLDLLHEHGGWSLRFTPTEIQLGDELVVGHRGKFEKKEETFSAAEERLPFMFYRDGIRAIQVLPQLTREDAENFLDALVAGCTEKATHDDLVTLLWQASLTHVRVDSVPLEQTFYLSSHATVSRSASSGAAPVIMNAVAGTEVRANLGQAAGVQGLHFDTFDDWAMAFPAVDVVQAFEELLPEVQHSRRRVLMLWAEEKDGDWDRSAPELFHRIIALDPGEDMRAALAHAAATWVTAMIAKHQVERAAKALELLHELDRDYQRSQEVLAGGIEQVEAAELAAYLDEADPAEQGRFVGLMVRLDQVAIPLTFNVMAKAARGRTRTAAATALCYQCADHPDRLQPHIDDPRVDVMLNLVQVLGHVGGAGVVEMLRFAAQHPDPRVRRQAILSLGGVPEAERVPVLLDELARLDPHILGVTLGLLARQRSEQVSKSILGLMEAPGFESRGEDVQRALFSALAEVAEDSAVPALAKLLHRSPGWLAKRTFTQFAAALTLLRLGTPPAKVALAAGLKSRDATVRAACLDAVKARAA